MRYASAYHLATDGQTLIPACGTAAQFPLDGRWSQTTCYMRARAYFDKAGYPAFRLPNSDRIFEVLE